MAASFDLTIFLDSVPPCFLRFFLFSSLLPLWYLVVVARSFVRPVCSSTRSSSTGHRRRRRRRGRCRGARRDVVLSPQPFLEKRPERGGGFCVRKKRETLAKNGAEKEVRKEVGGEEGVWMKER